MMTWRQRNLSSSPTTVPKAPSRSAPTTADTDITNNDDDASSMSSARSYSSMPPLFNFSEQPVPATLEDGGWKRKKGQRLRRYYVLKDEYLWNNEMHTFNMWYHVDESTGLFVPEL